MKYGTLLQQADGGIGLKHPTEGWLQFAAYEPVLHAVWSVDHPLLTLASADSTLAAPVAATTRA